MAAHGQKRRRIVDHRQPIWVLRLTHGQEARTERLHGGKLALGIRAGTDAGGTGRAATSREIRQSFERCLRTAVMIDQHTERARPDMVAANEAKPIELGLLRDSCRHAGRVAELGDERHSGSSVAAATRLQFSSSFIAVAVGRNSLCGRLAKGRKPWCW